MNKAGMLKIVVLFSLIFLMPHACQAGVSISGKIKGADGNPVRHLTMSVTLSSSDYTRKVSVNENGEYFFYDLPEGEYKIEPNYSVDIRTGFSFPKNLFSPAYIMVRYDRMVENKINFTFGANLRSRSEDWRLMMLQHQPVYDVIRTDKNFVAIGVHVYVSPDIESWSLSTTPQGKSLKSAVWTGKTIVAVGAGGIVYTSSDGLVWKYGFSGFDKDLLGIAWSGDSFVAVGADGLIITSKDGISWKKADSGIKTSLNGVVWGNGMFVVAGDGGAMLTSHDGVNWNKIKPLAPYTLNTATWSGSVFVVAGDWGTVLTSTDAVNWTMRESGTEQWIKKIIWTGDKFVAVGSKFTVITSKDGIAWSTKMTSKYIGVAMTGIAWSGNMLLATTELGDFYSSPDLEHWKRRVLNTGLNSFSHVARCGNRFVGVGGKVISPDEGFIYISLDGINWLKQMVVPKSRLNKVSCNKNNIVVVGNDGVIFTSTDGVSWILRKSGVREKSDIKDIIWTGKMFVAVGGSWHYDTYRDMSAFILTSVDGNSWGLYDTGVVGRGLIAVAAGKAGIVAVGDSGLIFSSTDGKTWLKRSSRARQSFSNIFWIGKNFATCVNYVADGAVYTASYTSSDGEKWIGNKVEGNLKLNRFILNGDELVGFYKSYSDSDKTKKIFSSKDGVNWKILDSGATYISENTAWSEHVYVSVDNGDVFVSSDLKAWSHIILLEVAILQDVKMM